MTFRAPPGEFAALAHAGPPFFRADWAVNVVGMVLDDETDWVEVAELVTDSYRVQAPRRLAFPLNVAAVAEFHFGPGQRPGVRFQAGRGEQSL